ncbi:tudor domain-containing 6 isoform X2 [Festucalex cinctus]
METLTETVSMASIHGPPARGSNVTILISRVHSYPHCELVEFWANFGQARAREYQSLAKNIQSPGNLFHDFEGNPGDLCLAQIEGTWYRSRIITRNGSNYQVFLIDQGITCSTTTNLLAWGKREHFQLSPEVEFCVLANVSPHSPENRWSPFALEFMQSLRGRTVKAHVQDVLVHERKLLLDIPCIASQMYEMGLAKKLEPSMFLDFVLKSPHLKTEAEKINQTSMGEVEQLHKKDLYMFPELSTGAVETVVVTEVTSPQRVFCQLKVFSQALKKLSEQITQCCRGRMVSCSVDPEMIGFPCAARGNDGSWYRSVLQQVFPRSQQVEVLNVDYGTKQLVQMENVRPLAPEFFKMPVVTYVCSLHGIFDKEGGWTINQINYLKSLLLHKTLIAKFHYQSITEGVYYVTLYGDENANLNNVFCFKEHSLQESEETLGEYAIGNVPPSSQHPPQVQNNEGMSSSGQTMMMEEKVERITVFPVESILPDSSHVACVSHISNPGEFWIQTQNHANELDKLMDGVFHLYKSSDNIYVMETPTLGACCAAKAADGDFYRAIVSEVGESKIKVFFVDYGGTEEVDWSNIRTLPDKFKKLPQLALKCSLAGLRPKDLRWSCSAIEFFTKTTTDKLLNVHVMGKHNDTHVVTLTDPKSRGERDIAKLMCSSGLAERNEMKKTSQISSEKPETGFLDVNKNKEVLFQTQNNIEPSSKVLQIGKFQENIFPIGSVLEVNVTSIESPNDFWCQRAQNSWKLKLLMRDIQRHYADSIYEPLTEAACVVRHPGNGMWYRGLVIRKDKPTQVVVLFVDYGQTKTVSLHDLRKISHEFLHLHGQAFRCSLLNPLEIMSLVNDWNDKAKEKFQNFVEMAASTFVPLKCTVYAVVYNEEKLVVNIVDLETPFESICTSMAELAHLTPCRTIPEPSYRLDTYYYSTHSIKIGTEEQVKVTCVNGVGQFYCQLERNADVLKDLNKKVGNLCYQLGNVKPPTSFQKLCFAKYTDGLWYRAQIKTLQPSILVYFVDYGDTAEVDKSDLIPVPKEAKDIMSVPMQAVLCSLSDVPTDVPSEVNDWFQSAVTECKFQALVIAKEPNGSLLVELYHKNTQINSKIKKMFQLQAQTEGKAHSQRQKALENANGVKEAKSVSAKVIHKSNALEPKPAHQARQVTHPSRPNFQKLYLTPHLRQKQSKQIDYTERKENLTVTNSKLDSQSPVEESNNVLPQTNSPKLPKLEDMPNNAITLDMEADVYVSHYNSPSSFYVQLVREEDEIFSLNEKLNETLSTPKISISEVDAGDLVEAEFPDDSLWYRASVKEVVSNSKALVEFVDFGNTAQVLFSKLAKLNQAFVQLPRYSTHCMLSEAESLEPLDAEVVSTLKREIGSNAEKILKCRFVQQLDLMWQVTLVDNGVQVTCKAPLACLEIQSEPEHEMDTSAQNSEMSLNYRHLEFTEGQQLDVYVSAFGGDHTFWCQAADSVTLDKLSESLSEIGNAAFNSHANISAFSPGAPCMVFFAEDQLWCRGEVVSQDGDDLSVLFVDYGNTDKVTGTDVREIPPELLQTHLQAFLCKLDGFDASHGSWCDGAAEELTSIATDKLLQMTVAKAYREDGKNMYLVQLECEGQRLNETMKRWWMTSIVDAEPDVAQHMPDEELGPIHVTVEKTENETPESKSTSLAVPVAHTGVDSDSGPPKDIQSTVDCLHTSILSSESPLEESCSSESEEVNMVPTVLIRHNETVSQIDSGRQEHVLPLQNLEKKAVQSGQDFGEEAASVMDKSSSDDIKSPPAETLQEAAESGQDFDEEAASVMDECLSDDRKSPSTETVQEAIDESGILLSPDELVDRHTISDCSIDTTDSADANVSTDYKVANPNPIMSGASVKMVPRDAVMNYVVPHEKADVTEESQLGAVTAKVIRSVQELTDPNEQSDGVMAAGNHRRISVREEETVPNEPLLPFEPSTGNVIEFSSEKLLPIPEEEEMFMQDESNTMAEDDMSDFCQEAGCRTQLCQDQTDVEEVICLVRDLCLKDTHVQENVAAMHGDQNEEEKKNAEYNKESGDGVHRAPLSPDDSIGDKFSDLIHQSRVKDDANTAPEE